MLRLLLVLFGGCAPNVGATTSAVVFGDDDRREPHEVEGAWANIARTQVATRIVDWAIDFSDPERPRVTYERTLGESLDLCEGEPFAEQIAPGSCSATLIDDRHLLTAGHCVLDAEQCEANHYWVFGFEVESTGALAPLSADDVYRCARVVVSDARDDFSILELDREVRGREPVELRLHEDGLPLDTPVSNVGFPNGIPVKVDQGGRVVFSAAGRYFRSTSDAFDSSSGSGVFDAEGRIVGILQRGYPDYVDAGGCNVVNVLDEEGDEGEIVGYLDAAMIAYCEARPESRHCSCEGPCWTSTPDAGATDLDAATMDATIDAGTIDAGTIDAGTIDAATVDAHVSSAGCAASSGARGWFLMFLVASRRAGPARDRRRAA